MKTYNKEKHFDLDYFRAKGVYSKQRSKKLSLSQQKQLRNDIANKLRVSEILKKYGITKPTYYRYKENLKA